MDLTLDFETYFDAKYSLKKLTTIEYVHDERFEIICTTVKLDDQPTQLLWGQAAIQEFLTRIRQEHNYINLVCHNTKFDGYICTQLLDFTPDYYTDTLSMSRGNWPLLPSGLKALAERLWPDDDSMRKGDELKGLKGLHLDDILADEDFKAAMTRYAVQDTDLTYAAFQKMRTTFPKAELDMINMVIRMFAEPSIVLDTDRVRKHLKNIEQHKADLLASVDVDKSVLASNKQFAEWLQAQDIEPPTKISPANGKITWAFGKNDVPYLEFKRKHPQLAQVFRVREEVKSTIEKSRSERLIKIAELTDRLPVPLKYSGAHTHRLSGDEKVNFQNFKNGSELRLSLCAPDGSLMYVSDLSQIEARMNCWLAGQWDVLELFAAKQCVYSDMASDIYGFKIDRKKHKKERNVGKVAVLGLGYQMGWAKFADTLRSGPMGKDPIDVTDEEAQHIVNVYRRKNYAIAHIWQELQTALGYMMHPRCDFTYKCLRFTHETIHLPNGLKIRYQNLRSTPDGIIYDGRIGQKTFIYGGKVLENVIQALAQIVIKKHMLAVDEYMQREMGGRIVLQVHDEIIGIGPETDAEKHMQEIYKIMRVAPDWCPDLPLDCDGGYAREYSK